jgi:hypothetical protein
MSAFLKNLPVKVPGAGDYPSEAPVYALHTTRSPPPCYTLYEYIPLYLFTQGRGARWTSEKVRGALVHKRGRKYQHD